MKRLSFLDALFLYAETPKTPMHVASVTIFKPTSPRDDFFARFREHVAARLELLPSYRRRLQATPLGIDHPVWVLEDKLDLDYHIRHQALPKPGGMEELRTLIGRLHAVPLDRSRPLWEYHFIEGLEGDQFAVYVKVHHSTMDGLAGMATLGVTYDFAPGAEHETLPLRIVPPDAEPSDLIELTSTAVGDFIRQGWRAAKSLPGVVRALRKAAPNFGRDARFLYSYVKDMPRTPFNKAISEHRVYATSSLPLDEVRALAKSRGATINDVVLALCAGALRRYLAEHGALPERPLRAGTAGVGAASRQCAAQQSGLFHALAPADRRRRAAGAARRGPDRRPGGEEPVRRHARPGDDGHLNPRRAARRDGTDKIVGGGSGRELPLAVLQCRHLERAWAEAGHVLCRRASHALFPGVDSLPRLRSQHYGAKLCRSARFRSGRL